MKIVIIGKDEDNILEYVLFILCDFVICYLLINFCFFRLMWLFYLEGVIRGFWMRLIVLNLEIRELKIEELV